MQKLYDCWKDLIEARDRLLKTHRKELASLKELDHNYAALKQQ